MKAFFYTKIGTALPTNTQFSDDPSNIDFYPTPLDNYKADEKMRNKEEKYSMDSKLYPLIFHHLLTKSLDVESLRYKVREIVKPPTEKL